MRIEEDENGRRSEFKNGLVSQACYHHLINRGQQTFSSSQLLNSSVIGIAFAYFRFEAVTNCP